MHILSHMCMKTARCLSTNGFEITMLKLCLMTQGTYSGLWSSPGVISWLSTSSVDEITASLTTTPCELTTDCRGSRNGETSTGSCTRTILGYIRVSKQCSARYVTDFVSLLWRTDAFSPNSSSRELISSSLKLAFLPSYFQECRCRVCLP